MSDGDGAKLARTVKIAVSDKLRILVAVFTTNVRRSGVVAVSSCSMRVSGTAKSRVLEMNSGSAAGKAWQGCRTGTSSRVHLQTQLTRDPIDAINVTLHGRRVSSSHSFHTFLVLVHKSKMLLPSAEQRNCHQANSTAGSDAC